MKKITLLLDFLSNNLTKNYNALKDTAINKKNVFFLNIVSILFLGLTFCNDVAAQTNTDNASNYSGSWTNGSNQGAGFGAWSITTPSNTGIFIGNPTNNGMSTTGIGATAFGLYSSLYNSGYCNASRGINGGMSVGDVLTFYWAVNWDGGNGSAGKGFDLKNGTTTIFNVGIAGSSTITTTNGTAFTGFGTVPMLVTVSRTSSNTYSFSMTARDSGTTYSTTINNSSSIDVLNFYIGNQNDNNGYRNMFFNAFQIQKPNQYRSKANGNWSTAATWEISTDGGSTWANASSAPISTLFSTITIQNGHTVSQNQNYSTGSNNNILVASGGTLNMTGASGPFQFNTMSVSGTLIRDDFGSTYNGSSILVNNGGVYRHAVNGGSIPTIIWASGSTFEVTGITAATSFLSGAIQSYHHVVWNCTSQTSAFSFGGLTTVNGNFTVQSTGASPGTSSFLLLTNSSTLAASIGGNLSILGGYFAPFGINTSGNCSLSIAGNLSIATGTFDVFRQAGNSATINLSGDFSMTSGTLTKGAAGTANFNFAKSGTQIYSKSGGTISSVINFAVNSGSIVNVGTSLIDGSTGTFNLNSGASFITANTGGIASTGTTGSIQVSGTRTYNSGANYTFNGSLAQVTGAGFTGAANLTISNSAGVTLSNNSSLSGILTLTSGAFTVGSANTISVSGGGSINAASGTLASGTGAGTFTFTGAGTVTGTVGFNNVNISGGVNFGSSSTVNGLLSLNSGGYVNTNPPIYASGSTLKYNTTGTYGRGSEWINSTGAGYPYHIQISNSTTVDMGANSGASVARQCAGNLTVDASSVFSMNTTPMSAAVTIMGNVVNNGTITLSGSVGGDLKTQGNINDSGAFNANNRAVFFNGGNTQVIQGTGTFDISYVRINKTSGSVQLATNLTCAGPNGGNAMEIDGANSLLDLNGFTLYLGASGVSSTYNNGIATPGYIKGSATSSISVLGNGALGTIKFDQTTPGTTNALNNFSIDINSSRSVTLGNSIAVGALSLASTSSLNLGTYIHTSGSLSLGGSGQASSSSYGGTGSPAATINTTYFATNTGVVNVGTCSTYSLTSTTAVACLGSSATVTLTNSTSANLPVGTYAVYYTLTGTNTGSSSGTMTVTSAGTGTFTTTSLANGGSTTITIDYIRNGCVSKITANNTATITINANPTASAGPVLSAICQLVTSAAMTGSVAGGATGGTWSGGAGTWANPSNPSTAVYTASASESGSVTLTLTTSGGSCGTTTASKTITINPLPTISLGFISDVPITATSFSIPYTATTNSPTTYSLSTTAASSGSSIAMPGFTPITAANIGASPIVVAIPTSAAAEYNFNLTITNANGCSSVYPFQFHVTSINHGAIGSDQTICSGTTPSALTNVTSGSASDGDSISYTWEQSTLIDSGYQTINGQTGTGYSPGVLTQTTYFKRVTHYTGTNPEITSDSAPVTITILTSVGGLVTTGATQTICSGTSPTDLTITGYTGNVVRWEKAATSDFSSPTAISISATTLASASIGTLTTTTYFRAVVQNTSCSVAYSNYATVTVSNTNTWTGTTNTLWNTATNWSCGLVPAATTNVFITSVTNQPIIASDIAINSLTINNGASLTVPTGFDLTVTDFIHNDGTMTVKNNANLIQTNTVVNTGNITVERNSAPLLRLDHTLWSSPVTGSQTLQQFSPDTLPNRFYTYTTSSNSYLATPATSTFTAAKGYGVRASNTHSSTVQTPFSGTFTGVPNNGNITFTLATDADVDSNYNLVGNPYPSTISAAAFLAANSSKIDGTIYFYSHSLTMDATGVFPQSQNSNGGGSNYSTCNGSGSVPSTTEATIFGVHAAPVAPSATTIQVGQGFIVRAISAGAVTFTNAMRVDTNNTNNSTPFMRTIEIERHRIWLNLKTATGIDINQMMVGYIEGATQAVDFNFDGLEFGNSGSSLTSKLEGGNYSIQGRSLPFVSNDEVPLAFKASASGNFMISLTNTDGLFLGNQDIFIRDNVMGIEHNIKVSPYVFTSAAGTFDSRFQLVYTQMLGIPSTDFTPDSVIVYKNTDWFHVNTKGITMKSIQVYDISGRLIFKQSDINASETVLRGLTKTNEVLFLKITSEDNVTVTVKIIN